jgi:magnesium transporter
MLIVLAGNPHRLQPLDTPAERALLAAAPWIDAISPSRDEVAAIEAATGLHVASAEELAEIETSSRLAEQGDALYLSLPIVARERNGEMASTSIGLVLNAERLITVRFARIGAFEVFEDRLARAPNGAASGAHVLVGLLEALVDGFADMLERSRAELDLVSRRIFQAHAAPSGPAAASAELRSMLRDVGRAGETVSEIRDSLLALSRLVPFVSRPEVKAMPKGLGGRLKMLRRDIASLSDYDAHLTQKVQFLLDAILGFINIAQSNIIKLMTVVGVVGVPPTLIASIYGMNFTDMPELHWALGYPMALAAIIISAVVPVIWFKRRGWL